MINVDRLYNAVILAAGATNWIIFKIFYAKSLMAQIFLKETYFRLWIGEELNQLAYLVTPILLI